MVHLPSWKHKPHEGRNLCHSICHCDLCVLKCLVHNRCSILSSVQSLSSVRLIVTPWIAARQASLSITNSWSLLKLMSIESVMPSNHLILCQSLHLLLSIFPSIRVFSNESAFHIRWPISWSFSFNISPSNVSDFLWISLLTRMSQNLQLQPSLDCIGLWAFSVQY